MSRPVDEGASSGSSGRVGGVRFTPALASVPEWHMGSFRTVDVWRGLGRVGGVWRGLARVGREGREGAKIAGKSVRGGLALWAHIGPPHRGEAVRAGDHFFARVMENVGFSRDFGGKFFYF